LKVKAFDVYNNSSEKEIKFVVAEQDNLVLEHVLNYPNPFTTRTEFMFEHNYSCNYMNVQIQVFTISGKLVKTIDQDVNNTGFRVNGIFWDGRDDYGDKLARGTYIYRLKTRTNNITAEKIERLVILY
jgi:flagellar hook assembly protein FlgD